MPLGYVHTAEKPKPAAPQAELRELLPAYSAWAGSRGSRQHWSWEYLHPRRGRGSSQPWSPDSAAPELALVQFSQGRAQRAGAHNGDSSNGGGNGSRDVAHAATSPRVQLQQLSGLPDLTAAAGNGTSCARRRRRRTDHDREERSTGEGFLTPAWL